jgi:hypothetical protein
MLVSLSQNRRVQGAVRVAIAYSDALPNDAIITYTGIMMTNNTVLMLEDNTITYFCGLGSSIPCLFLALINKKL